MRKIRILSFLIYLVLCFAPLGSCTVKVDQSSNSSRMTFHETAGVPADLRKDEQISEIKIVGFENEKGEGDDRSGLFVVALLLISFLGVNTGKALLIFKPLVWLSYLLLGLSYLCYSAAAILAMSTTLFGWLFVLNGATYLFATGNALLPKAIRLS